MKDARKNQVFKKPDIREESSESKPRLFWNRVLE